MTVISKELFYKKVGSSVMCSEIHYWEPNCVKSILSPYLIGNLVAGAGKFFIPIYVLKLLINYRRVKDPNLWKSLVVSECKSILYGIAMGVSIISFICFLRKLSGRLHYYNLVVIPFTISGLSLLVESRENQILDTLIFFNSFVEALFNNLDYFNVFKVTKTREILMFSAVSASLMYLMENRTKKIDYVYFWFYTPPLNESGGSTDGKLCIHPNSCYNFFFEGCWKYFSLGYLVNIIRKLIPKMGTLSRRPMEIFRILFNKYNVKFGLFIGGYVGIYRILTCYLRRTKVVKKKFHGLIGGLVSGLTYAISPNIQVLVIGITTLLQLLYEYVSDKLRITNHFWPRQLLFMLCHGLLGHNKMFYADTCPTYYKNMVDACSNNVTAKMLDQVIKKYIL